MKREISPTRLEAFSDGVIAIIITIMVLELKVPESDDPKALLQLWPVFISYLLSFIKVGIYWINHHHLLHFAKNVDLKILWANNMLLFFISLIPFFTSYLGEHHFNSFSMALYAGSMLVCAASFLVLREAIACSLRDDEEFRKLNRLAVRKNGSALMLYMIAILTAFYSPLASFIIVSIVAVIYVVPTALINKL